MDMDIAIDIDFTEKFIYENTDTLKCIYQDNILHGINGQFIILLVQLRGISISLNLTFVEKWIFRQI